MFSFNKISISVSFILSFSPLAANFGIGRFGFSQNVYKDLKKVSTVTLDPLDKKESVMKVKEAREKYPTITGYLENLELRRDLLR